ncbi:MAG: zinc ABC transporter substrate-binding protein [Gammaproteobacteria bacterium]|nr:zinc ABC transporter substrate-binding protein [Gammaproteobacteria bacterium]
MATSASAETNSLRIVASIKPVHSLVTAITQGVGEAELLMSTNQSPHHYSLRPSERRMLANADVIFWIGPNLESFMPRILESLDDNSKAVALIQTPGLKLLPIRSADHDHGEPGHAEDNDKNHADETPSHDEHAPDHFYTNIDAHIWLNTANVETLIDAITQRLIALDPEHQPQYLANSRQLRIEVAQLRSELQQSLNSVDTAFITYHDGYQYFENEFSLNNAGFVTSSELQPGARRVSELKQMIREQGIDCIFYDAPVKPPLLKALLSEAEAGAFMLDPVGIFVEPGREAWFKIMRTMANEFIHCRQQ